MKETAEQAKKRGIAIITMCLMSNPEYKREKNKLVQITDGGFMQPKYRPEHVRRIGSDLCVRQYIQLAHDAKAYGVDGLVIGAQLGESHKRRRNRQCWRILYKRNSNSYTRNRRTGRRS
jgi:hypothetical protein